MKIDRKKLLSDLELVIPGLSKKEIVSQSGCFVFKNNRILTYNDELAVTLATELDVNGAVKADEFFKVLKRMRSDVVDIEVKNNELIISTKSTKCGVPLVVDISLPFDGFDMPDTAEDISAEDVLAISDVSKVCSKVFGDGVLWYVHVQNGKAVACDSYRASRRDVKSSLDMYVSSTVAAVLPKYKPMKVAVKNNWIFFANSDGVVLASRSIEDEGFPDVASLFEFDGKTLELPSEMIDAINASEIFIKNNDNIPLTVSLKDKVLMVSCQTDDGWYKERYDVGTTGNFSFDTVPEVLKDALNRGAAIIVGENSVRMNADGFEYVAALMTEEEDDEA